MYQRLRRSVVIVLSFALLLIGYANPSQAIESFGSAKLDGTSGYLNAGSSPDWNIGTGDFTVEWFQYQTGTSTFPRIFSLGTYSGGAPLAVSIESGTVWVRVASSWATSYSLGDQTNYFHKWVHFALTRASGMLRLYVDGVRVREVSNSANIDTTGLSLLIGTENTPSTYFPGYITNFHYLNGNALYTGATLTIPTSPISAVAGTKLLLKFDTSGNFLIDSSGTGKSVSVVGGVVYDANNPFTITVPSAPTLNSATGGSLSWLIPPYNGGSPITDYEYQLDNTNPWISMNTTGTTFSITGLSDGNYSVKIRARNVSGAGSESNSLSFTIGGASCDRGTLTRLQYGLCMKNLKKR